MLQLKMVKLHIIDFRPNLLDYFDKYYIDLQKMLG